MNSAVIAVLTFLSDGDKPRYTVTKRIKNYAANDRAEAVSFLVKGGHVALIEGEAERGRKPVNISLTESGKALAKKAQAGAKSHSVWCVQ